MKGLENRFARAVGDDLAMLRKEHGFWATRKLEKTLRDLFRGRHNAQHGVEARAADPPGATADLQVPVRRHLVGGADAARAHAPSWLNSEDRPLIARLAQNLTSQ